MLELGLKYELKAGDGLPAVVDLAEFESARENLMAAETPARPIQPNHSGRRWSNLPDTGIGS